MFIKHLMYGDMWNIWWLRAWFIEDQKRHLINVHCRRIPDDLINELLRMTKLLGGICCWFCHISLKPCSSHTQSNHQNNCSHYQLWNNTADSLLLPFRKNKIWNANTLLPMSDEVNIKRCRVILSVFAVNVANPIWHFSWNVDCNNDTQFSSTSFIRNSRS